jgi:hypothetical protein
MRPRVAWGLAGFTLVTVVLDAFITAQYRPLWSEASVARHGFPFVSGAVLGSAVMGALIISRYERHPIGWLLSLVGATSAFSLLTEAYGIWVHDADGPGSEELASAAAWLSQLIGGQLAIGALALMFMLAPDGQLVSRRWRYVAWLPVLGVLLCWSAILSVSPTSFQITTETEDVGPVRELLLSLGFLCISLALILSFVSTLRRLRLSRGEKRQQVLLIATSAALIALGLISLVVVQLSNGGKQTWLASMPLYVAYFLLPILFAIAVLRYRLYDLDVIINRTVILVAGTAFAALGYTFLVVTVGRMVEGRTSGFWVSLLATALVALAFQPLRRSVVRMANRLAYGVRAQPYEALSDFSNRLAGTPSPDTLLPAVAEAAARAVSARGATATLDTPGGDPVTATWGDGDGVPDQVIPVRNDGITLGSVEVYVPPGRGLRPSDERLLEALADQTAVAFRNTALATSLAVHVAELDRTTGELAESRRRIIEADDAVRRTLEASIARQVLPYLVALPDELRVARRAVGSGSAENGINRLVDSTNAALEALRDLTRGVFPTQLTRSGLEPALRSLLSRSGLEASLTVDGAANQRFSPRVETALYFCCVEAARVGSGRFDVALSLSDDDLVLRIDGVDGGVVDVQSITDRVEAAGGNLSTEADTMILTVGVGSRG